ncbi:hypothetical protein ACFY7C_19320 [Streptomyces sp. NPDC012769]|uniref:DUF6197 family protein n=1 Tax=Streptomyces sp. NPDC012769 TaxID=3364848 RepID=UPI0036CF9A1A
MNKADIYRKAAEIIVRDGQFKGELTSGGEDADALKDPSLPVCAIGACARAEYELYGTLPWERPNGDPYDYAFRVGGEYSYNLSGVPRAIYYVNDDPRFGAEDIALVLKQRAAELDDAG